jgi:PHS family inorganic phosphate transporter-like MFS transporter
VTVLTIEKLGRKWIQIQVFLHTAYSVRVNSPAVFFGCCIAGALFSLLLPEVRGRDPDSIFAREIKEGLA